MSSIRTIDHGGVKIKWNTGAIRGLWFNEKDIMDDYYEYVKPSIKIKEGEDVRQKVDDTFIDLLHLERFQTMAGFCRLVMAFRICGIYTDRFDEEGYMKTFWMESMFPNAMRNTYYNIAYHMNHHCKQLWRCCFIMIKETENSSTRLMSFTSGPAYDDKDRYFLDLTDLFKEDKKKQRYNSNAKGFHN